MPDSGDKSTFRLGLVMAGAISAGAYTGGVVDFLIQALDEWEKAKADPNAAVPRHNVQIPVMSGASAGAITSAIAAVALNSETTPVVDVDNPPAENANRLYDAWVRQIDLSKLLQTGDIGGDRPVVSLLDSTVLDNIARKALDAPKRAEARAYVADPLGVFLTVTNLRGVPYGFELFGGDETFVYGMLRHMDDMRFAVSRTGAELSGARTLDPAKAPDDEWPRLAAAALASSAFPIGLRPRALDRRPTDYDGRLGVESGKDWIPIKPRWSDPSHPPNPYDFLTVDGGLINNEPLELARQRLENGRGQPDLYDGEKADHAVVMIDPFPNVLARDVKADLDPRVVKAAMKMFGALVNQARFRPEELAAAAHRDVYNRFAIMPSRFNAAGGRAELAMASAILGGFGGFLSETFRRHDFNLGRRNCQAFLRWHFCLPETNKIFTFKDENHRQQWYVQEKDGKRLTFPSKERGAVPFLPIIPLCGTAAEEVKPRPFPPTATVDKDRLREQVAVRVSAVGDALIETELKGLAAWPLRWIIRKGWRWWFASKVTEKAMTKISEELNTLDARQNR